MYMHTCTRIHTYKYTCIKTVCTHDVHHLLKCKRCTKQDWTHAKSAGLICRWHQGRRTSFKHTCTHTRASTAARRSLKFLSFPNASPFEGRCVWRGWWAPCPWRRKSSKAPTPTLYTIIPKERQAGVHECGTTWIVLSIVTPQSPKTRLSTKGVSNHGDVCCAKSCLWKIKK